MAQIPELELPQRIGASSVEHVECREILTRPSGFMDGYDFTLNPYAGCTFGCSYCYAAAFARGDDLRSAWGGWVQVKRNALALLARRRTRPLVDKAIYMSSVTDPYQPIERKLQLSRAILEELLIYHQVRLVIQTRSPLVTRDLDLLKLFPQLQVNISVTTDSEQVRKVFEPGCPSNGQRLAAVETLAAAGISTCVTMTPLLPLEDVRAFAERLRASGARRFVVQPFHPERGRFVAGTRQQAIERLRALGWDQRRYHEAIALMRAELPELREGKDGFAPL